MELILRANGDYWCGNCRCNIELEDTCLNEHICPKCKKEYKIPKEAYFMYEDIAIKDNAVVEVCELSMSEQMQVHLAKKAREEKGEIPLINLNKIYAVH